MLDLYLNILIIAMNIQDIRFLIKTNYFLCCAVLNIIVLKLYYNKVLRKFFIILLLLENILICK